MSTPSVSVPNAVPKRNGARRALLTLGGAIALSAPALPTLALPGVSAARAEAPAAVSAAASVDIAAASPFELAETSKAMWARGDRLQAAFWFYVFQIRTAPWAEAQPDLLPLRGAVNDSLGRTINEWLASDVEAWEELAERAIAYEAGQPLWSDRPEGVDAAEWRDRVERARATYARDFRQVFASFDAGDIAAMRREHGLPVGPLDQPGAPLDPNWL